MAIDCRELNTLEIALAVIDEADKVQYINYIKELPSEPARNAALWTKKSGAAWVARHGLTAQQYQSAFSDYVKKGYRLTFVNGYAVGQGLSIALACDIRIASDEAGFGAIWTRRGIPPESSGAYLLTHLVGPARACELIFMGKIIDATEAEKIGLINQRVAADQLPEVTQETARQIADGPPVAIGISKMMVYQALETSLEVHSRLEFFGQDYSFNTKDREEGIQSFLEKRPPKFTGE